MVIIRNRHLVFPGAYALCCQTVTVYHKAKETGEITQHTYEGVYFGRGKTQNTAKEGTREESSTLLIIPGDAAQIFPGDKVIEGEGTRIASAEDWARVIPSTTPGLVVIRSVHPVKYQDKIVHIEAEG